MSSLYKRATPAQRVALAVVEGAIKNAAEFHPEIKVNPRHRRSIAKRAVGTLTAVKWPPALAADVAASRLGNSNPRPQPSQVRGAHLTSATRHRSELTTGDEGGGQAPAAALGRAAEWALRKLIWHVKRAGDDELFAAIVVVMRLLAERRTAP